MAESLIFNLFQPAHNREYLVPPSAPPKLPFGQLQVFSKRSVLCEYAVPDKAKECDNVVGCDVGLKEFATLSDGTIISNPKHTKKYENKLAKEQRKLSKKQKGGKNRFKQRLKVRKIQNKIRDTRKDFLHKISNSIAKNYEC